ncbi:MAG: TIGR03854 family LLM class F420-dependent oxidoreductase [Kibdelosporangium sp.]
MKVRIGVGLGPRGGPGEFVEAVDHAEALGIDSLWLSEVVFSEHVDPFVGMAYALSRTKNLKVGTGVAVLPGRNPVLVAKQLATLAALAPKRVLPVFGLQPARRAERQVFDVPHGRRAAAFDETLQVVRMLLEQDEVTFDGEFTKLDQARIAPRPQRVDIWLGGSAPAGLERVGRYADGWLGSFLSPDQARDARVAIEATAAAAGREIEADHYGISLAVATDGVPPELLETARRRSPGTDPADLIADGWSSARDLIGRYVDAGLTKFVVRPASPVPSIRAFLDDFAAQVKPLEAEL